LPSRRDRGEVNPVYVGSELVRSTQIVYIF